MTSKVGVNFVNKAIASTRPLNIPKSEQNIAFATFGYLREKLFNYNINVCYHVSNSLINILCVYK